MARFNLNSQVQSPAIAPGRTSESTQHPARVLDPKPETVEGSRSSIPNPPFVDTEAEAHTGARPCSGSLGRTQGWYHIFQNLPL